MICETEAGTVVLKKLSTRAAVGAWDEARTEAGTNLRILEPQPIFSFSFVSNFGSGLSTVYFPLLTPLISFCFFLLFPSFWKLLEPKQNHIFGTTIVGTIKNFLLGLELGKITYRSQSWEKIIY